jgi:hypothetical protein
MRIRDLRGGDQPIIWHYIGGDRPGWAIPAAPAREDEQPATNGRTRN